MNENWNLPQTEVALTVEIAAVLKSFPQSLDTDWVAVPCTQVAPAPVKMGAYLGTIYM